MVAPIDVSMPLNHTFSVAYLQFQVVMVAFTVMMVAFSAKGGYDHRYAGGPY